MIPKADRDADAAILAAATQGTWITVAPRSQEGGVQLAGFGPALAPRWPTATSLRVGGTDSNTAKRAADISFAAAQMTMGQHAANAKAAAHAVNRLPEYIADAAEMERRIDRIEAWHKASTDPEHGDPDESAEMTLAIVLEILRGSA
jgi:hypothetical protein